MVRGLAIDPAYCAPIKEGGPYGEGPPSHA